MAKLILFNKPYLVLSQFSDDSGRKTLSDYIPEKNVYPAGRLDYDSEGLLLLTDDGSLQHRISHPLHKMAKTYLAQVEGDVTEAALTMLRQGVELNDGKTRPAGAERIEAPQLWEREPPVRFRLSIPTSWIRLTISEGRNRQVRRMTALVGFPTLRLIRYSIGTWTIDDLSPGAWRTEQVHLPQQKAALPSRKAGEKRRPSAPARRSGK